ncbi:MAG: DUF1648 domain-containing protein [Bryobacteraceae bacterium]|nr:DUF1648 domain-containing protein [Bryobacteraceae bacterium]
MMQLVLCAVYLFTGALLLALPNLTRRGILFAVRVPENFRDGREGRRAIGEYRGIVGAVLLAGVTALLLSPPATIGIAAAVIPLVQLVAAGTAFYRQHKRLRRFSVRDAGPRQVEVTSAPERLPWYAWLGAGPFAILLAAALFLNANWERIPERFPVHWGATGQPDRWAERSVRGVYGPLIFGAELAAFFVVMALAAWYGSRRSRSRITMLGFTIAIQYMLGVLFAMIALQPLFQIPVWVIVIAPMGFLVPALLIAARKMSEPGQAADPTPEDCWKAGIIYYNPDDAVLFVERREGLGYTFNFANPASWALVGLLAAVILSGFFILA